MRLLLAAVVTLLCALPLQAAPLILGSGNITFDTDTLQLTGAATASGSLFGNTAVFTFDSVDLGSGANVTLQGARPLQILSHSGLSLNTTLAANGGNGVNNTTTAGAAGFGGAGILGGGNGGRAGQLNDGTDGTGPGAGGGQTNCCGGGSGAGYGGGGGQTHDSHLALPLGITYGNAEITTLLGGSGGGGGAGDNACCFSNGSGGGAGGGAIGLAAGGDLSVGTSASIEVKGGNTGNSRSGGGGSGGSIALSGDNVTLAAGSTLSAAGGSADTTHSGARIGGAGGGGRVAILSDSSLTTAGTIDVSPGTGYTGGGTPAIPIQASAGTTSTGTSDGLVSSLNLGTGNYLLAINTDLGAMTYIGDQTGHAAGSVVGGVATFNLDSINLGSGVTVVLEGDNPLSLRSTGAVTINTTIDASGGDGTPRSGSSGGVGGTAPGGDGILGGGDGGRGGLGTSSTPGLQGEGDGGGGGQRSCCGGGSGGGFGGEGGFPRTDTAAATPVGATYGDPTLEVLEAGSGGGGGAGTNTCCNQGGGGGAGGGALEIISMENWITIGPTGQILLDGGEGAGVGAGGRDGGGGSGGGLKLFSMAGISIEGLISADGGISHLTSSRGGGGGGGGRIALFAPQVRLGGLGQDEGLLSSSAFASVLGGAGSSHAQGGTPGGAGTINFSIVPEPSTLLIWSLLAGLGIGLRWRRRK